LPLHFFQPTFGKTLNKTLKTLDARNLKKFRKIVEIYRDDIVRKWIDFFVYNIEIKPEKITQKI
jgi:hypothetical protein